MSVRGGETQLHGEAPAGTPPVGVSSTFEGLLALYLLQDFAKVKAAQGYPPSADWFRRHGVVQGLTAGTNRRVVIRLIRRDACLGCEKKMAESSTGDHLVAIANGGPAGIDNYVPLCGRCNSSKGTRDFLDWWLRRDRRVAELPPDVLTAYCRLTFQNERRLGTLTKPAPSALARAVEELGDDLPGEHRDALGRRVAAIVGSG